MTVERLVSVTLLFRDTFHTFGKVSPEGKVQTWGQIDDVLRRGSQLRAKSQCDHGTKEAAKRILHGGMHEAEPVRQVLACREISVRRQESGCGLTENCKLLPWSRRPRDFKFCNS